MIYFFYCTLVIQFHTILLGKVFVIVVKSKTLCALKTVYEVVDSQKHIEVVRPQRHAVNKRRL